MSQIQTQIKYIDATQLSEEELKQIINEVVEVVKNELKEIRKCINEGIDRLLSGGKLDCEKYEIKIERSVTTSVESISELKSKIRDNLEEKIGIKYAYGGIYNYWLLVRKNDTSYMELVLSILSIYRYSLYDISPYSIQVPLIGY